jgi:hypothetical protein
MNEEDEITQIPLRITETVLANMMESVMRVIDKTAFGPLITYGGTPEQPKKIISQVAFPLYIEVLKSLLSNIKEVQLTPDPPPSDIITDF